MKKLSVFILSIASILTSCSSEEDLSESIMGSLVNRYYLTDIQWDGKPFDWNGDGVIEPAILEVNHDDYINPAHQSSLGISKWSRHCGSLGGGIPAQEGDTTSSKQIYRSIANIDFHVEVAKHNNVYDVIVLSKNEEPINANCMFGKPSLSRYTNANGTYNDGKLILSYDAVFFDPVSWKDVSGKIAFTYAIKTE